MCLTTQAHSNNHIPPNPGEFGKVGMIGMDRDNDGYRDDIEIAMNSRYPKSQEMQSILNRSSSAFTLMLIAGDKRDVDLAEEALEISSIALQCIHLKSHRPQSDIKQLMFMSTNTERRFDAYHKYIKLISSLNKKMDKVDQPCLDLNLWFEKKMSEA